MRVVFSDSCPNPSLMTERGDAKYIRYGAGGDDVSGLSFSCCLEGVS